MVPSVSTFEGFHCSYVTKTTMTQLLMYIGRPVKQIQKVQYRLKTKDSIYVYNSIDKLHANVKCEKQCSCQK